MVNTTDLYQIDGKPIPVPDSPVDMSFEDLDAADAGRDEAGFMHRAVVRSKLGVWNFTYSYMSQEAYTYLQSLLPEEGVFRFTYPDPRDPGQACNTEAYLSRYGISWHNARTGLYRNMKFSVIEC